MHAYLIIAHEHFKLLEYLISCIDDRRNDIYIHFNQLDGVIPFDQIEKQAKYSKVYFAPRVKIYRGSFSIMEATFSLLTSATSTKEYEYYHLLSGQDLPIKTQSFIHDFFKIEGKNTYNFVDIRPAGLMGREWQERTSLHWFLMKYYLEKGFSGVVSRLLNDILHRFERLIKVDRTRKYKTYSFSFGSSWFSITNSFANFLISKHDEIKAVFGQGYIPEESVLQTLLISTEFKDTVYYSKTIDGVPGNFRKIEWDKGVSPRVLTSKDYDNLINSPCLFARKFDENVDLSVIELIAKEVIDVGERL